MLWFHCVVSNKFGVSQYIYFLFSFYLGNKVAINAYLPPSTHFPPPTVSLSVALVHGKSVVSLLTRLMIVTAYQHWSSPVSPKHRSILPLSSRDSGSWKVDELADIESLMSSLSIKVDNLLLPCC